MEHLLNNHIQILAASLEGKAITYDSAFRLNPVDDLKKELESYIKANNILAGWISCGVGSLTNYNIRFANQAERSKGKGHFEIASLIATLSVNGSHIHISVSDSTGQQSVDIY